MNGYQWWIAAAASADAQYLAYMAWLRLGEVAVNPFGDDDDDFDIIGVFDNHIQVQ